MLGSFQERLTLLRTLLFWLDYFSGISMIFGKDPNTELNFG